MTTDKVEITTGNPSVELCPPGTFENIPHPELCNSFYMCAGGIPIQLFCSDGFEFDPVTRVSKSESNLLQFICVIKIKKNLNVCFSNV